MTVFRFDRGRLLIRNGIVVAGVALWASTGDVLGLSLLALLVAVTVWALRRPRLAITEKRITVANLLTTTLAVVLLPLWLFFRSRSHGEDTFIVRGPGRYQRRAYRRRLRPA